MNKITKTIILILASISFTKTAYASNIIEPLINEENIAYDLITNKMDLDSIEWIDAEKPSINYKTFIDGDKPEIVSDNYIVALEQNFDNKVIRKYINDNGDYSVAVGTISDNGIDIKYNNDIDIKYVKDTNNVLICNTVDIVRKPDININKLINSKCYSDKGEIVSAILENYNIVYYANSINSDDYIEFATILSGIYSSGYTIETIRVTNNKCIAQFNNNGSKHILLFDMDSDIVLSNPNLLI